MQNGNVRDGDVDGDAGVEVAAVVFGEGCVGWGEDDGAGDFYLKFGAYLIDKFCCRRPSFSTADHPPFFYLYLR